MSDTAVAAGRDQVLAGPMARMSRAFREANASSEAQLAALAEDHGCVGEVEDTGVLLACRPCTERVYPPAADGDAGA